jgi:hypothetical protein
VLAGQTPDWIKKRQAHKEEKRREDDAKKATKKVVRLS